MNERRRQPQRHPIVKPSSNSHSDTRPTTFLSLIFNQQEKSAATRLSHVEGLRRHQWTHTSTTNGSDDLASLAVFTSLLKVRYPSCGIICCAEPTGKRSDEPAKLVRPNMLLLKQTPYAESMRGETTICAFSLPFPKQRVPFQYPNEANNRLTAKRNAGGVSAASTICHPTANYHQGANSCRSGRSRLLAHFS